MNRSPIKRRRTEPRRTRHPLPLPNGEPRVTLAEAEGEAFAFGPQAALCRMTECAACFAVRHWSHGHARTKALPWSDLQEYEDAVSIPHHEPHRSTTGMTLDDGVMREVGDADTYPLCRTHHTDGWDCCRHRLRSDGPDMRSFYALLPFDWRAVVAEMRRRVAQESP